MKHLWHIYTIYYFQIKWCKQHSYTIESANSLVNAQALDVATNNPRATFTSRFQTLLLTM